MIIKVVINQILSFYHIYFSLFSLFTFICNKTSSLKFCTQYPIQSITWKKKHSSQSYLPFQRNHVITFDRIFSSATKLCNCFDLWLIYFLFHIQLLSPLKGTLSMYEQVSLDCINLMNALIIVFFLFFTSLVLWSGKNQKIRKVVNYLISWSMSSSFFLFYFNITHLLIHLIAWFTVAYK